MDLFAVFFVVLVIYNILYDGYVHFKAQEVVESSEKNESISGYNIPDLIIKGLACLFSIIILIYTLVSNSIPGIVAIIVLALPTVLMRVVVSIRAAISLRKIILDNNDTSNLSIKEKMQFDLFVVGILAIFQMVPIKMVVSFVENNVQPIVIAEVIISIYILFCSFFITIILIVELIVPIKQVRDGCDFIASRLNKFCEQASRYFCRTWNNQLVGARLTNRILGIIPQFGLLFKLLLFLFLAFAVLMDLIINIFMLMYSFIVCFCLWSFFEFLITLGSGVMAFLNRITEIPDYRVVQNTFRLAGIVAVFVVVISNRMCIFITPKESFIAVTEFLASAIVIPIIFEWIYSSQTFSNR